MVWTKKLRIIQAISLSRSHRLPPASSMDKTTAWQQREGSTRAFSTRSPRTRKGTKIFSASLLETTKLLKKDLVQCFLNQGWRPHREGDGRTSGGRERVDSPPLVNYCTNSTSTEAVRIRLNTPTSPSPAPILRPHTY